ISDAFAQIEHQPNIYDVVHVKYFDEEPLKLDFVISFPDHGFHLRFDPWSQVCFSHMLGFSLYSGCIVDIVDLTCTEFIYTVAFVCWY
uniref:Uncharacterized protein n=1 Tax=Aegilops tauschii subsp. strangulata TaxID=200361 RepID=A0A453SGS1_AEGTS